MATGACKAHVCEHQRRQEHHVATAPSWLQSCVQVLRKFGNAGSEGGRFFRLPLAAPRRKQWLNFPLARRSCSRDEDGHPAVAVAVPG